MVERADADAVVEVLPYKDIEASFIRLEKLGAGEDVTTDFGWSYEEEWGGRCGDCKNSDGSGSSIGSSGSSSSNSREFEPLPRRARLGMDDIVNIVRVVVVKTLPSILRFVEELNEYTAKVILPR